MTDDTIQEVEVSNNFLHTLVDSLVRHTGQKLFEEIATHLSTFLRCEYAIIGRRMDSNTIGTLAVHACDKIADNFSYNLIGTPCHQIMDPFFTTKPKEKGTGMGLWVVHGIIKTMGGFIHVTSDIGQGSVFNVYLPVYNKTTKSETDPPQTEIPGGSETILFVDDEKSLVQLAKVSLSNLGYSVTTYTNSREALDYFKNNFENVDLVISDMTMPEMTGDIFCHHIRLIKPGCHVILCTGYKETIDDKKNKLMDYNVVLFKPISLSSMACTIRDVLDMDKKI